MRILQNGNIPNRFGNHLCKTKDKDVHNRTMAIMKQI